MENFKILLKRELREKLNRLTKKNLNVANIIFNFFLDIQTPPYVFILHYLSSRINWLFSLFYLLYP